MQTLCERYSLLVQTGDEVQTSAEPVSLFEVEPIAQAHTASVFAVAAVLAYVGPLPQTVIGDEHCDAATVVGEIDVDDAS